MDLNLQDRLIQFVCDLHMESRKVSLPFYDASRLVSKFEKKTSLLFDHLSEEYGEALSGKCMARWEKAKQEHARYSATINSLCPGVVGDDS